MSNTKESLKAKGLTLYLQEIKINKNNDYKFSVKVKCDDQDVSLREERDQTDDPKDDSAPKWDKWIPSPSLELSDTSNLKVVVKAERKKDFLSFINKPEPAKLEVPGHVLMDAFWDGKESLDFEDKLDNHPLTVTFLVHPSDATETTRSAVQGLEEAMKKFHPVLSGTAQTYVDGAFYVGSFFASVSPISSAAFTIAEKTYDILKEQQKYDDMVPGLAQNIAEILPFANAAVNDIIANGDMELLEKAAKDMYKLVEETAYFICGYVKRSPAFRAVKYLVSSKDQGKIAGFSDELVKLKEYFDRALSVETLKQAKIIDNRLILDRLKPTSHAGYQEDRGCMEGTRTVVLNDISEWAKASSTPENPSETKNFYWLHGTPGLGKTALATSVCMRLHESKLLGGSFFCRRDDPVLSQPKYVLPAIIYHLAELFAPYGRSVAQALRDDPQLNAETTSQLLTKLLLNPINSLRKPPPHPFVIVIDALDECGNDASRKVLLEALTKVLGCATWLKVIVTSRPEQDIQLYFQSVQTTTALKVVIRDLVQVQASNDIHLFTQTRLEAIAANCGMPPDWPGPEKLDQIVSRSGGIFMYVETVARLLGDTMDPEDTLNQIIDGTKGAEGQSESEAGFERLNDLYLHAIELVVGKKPDERKWFRTFAGAIIAVSSYRPLCDESVATLSGLKPHTVTVLVNKLGSLFYRDTSGTTKTNDQNKRSTAAIRVRHLSIIEFLTKSDTSGEFQVDLAEINNTLATSSLNLMLEGLKFNICQLETSSHFNSQVQDLGSRVDRSISDPLQYSCMYGLNHLRGLNDASKECTGLVEKLLGSEKVLFWLEALSVLGAVPTGRSCLRELRKWTKGTQEHCHDLVVDTLRFVNAFYTVIISSAPHIYLSALPFAPANSLICNNAKDLFRDLLNVTKGRLQSWPSRPQAWIGHTDKVAAVAYSPDGLKVASASWDTTVRIWDADTGELVGDTLIGHTGHVYSVAFSPDGRIIVSGSIDMTVRIWDAVTGAPLHPPLSGHTGAVNSIACSPDASRIVSASDDRTLRIWDAHTGEAIGQPLIGPASPIVSVAYSHDGSRLVSGDEDKIIRIWDAKEGEQVCEPLKGHTDFILSVAFSPDGRYVASGYVDKTIRIWSLQSGEVIGQPFTELEGRVRTLAFSPNGSQLVVGANNPHIIDFEESGRLALRKTLEGHGDEVYSVFYSPDGVYIISGSADKTIRIWDAKTGEPVGSPSPTIENVSMGSIECVAYSPNGSRIVSGAEDNLVRIWNAQTGEPIGEPLGGHFSVVETVAYSPNGSQFASGSIDGTIRIWNPETGEAIGQPFNAQSTAVRSVDYSPDGSRIAAAYEDSYIRIWNAQSGELVGQPWKGHTGALSSVTYSPDGTQLVSSDRSGTLILWNSATGEAIGQPLKLNPNFIRSVAFSPDGAHVAFGATGPIVRVWEPGSGQVTEHPLKGKPNFVTCVAYSKPATTSTTGAAVTTLIASGSNDNTVQLQDAGTGEVIGQQLTGHTNVVRAIAFSPDGSHLVSTSVDETIRVWETQNAPFYDLNAVLIANLKPEAKPEEKLELGANGWVQDKDKLVFWVPEDCRQGLTCAAVLTIPDNGRNRSVRVDMSQMRYGTAWNEIVVRT